MHIQIGPVMAAPPPPGHYHALFPTSLTFISVTPSDDHLFVQTQLPASKAPLPNLSPRAPRLRWAPGLKHAFSHCHVPLCACVMGCLVANFDLWDVTFDTWHLRSPVVTICISWPDKSCEEPPTLCCTHYQPSENLDEMDVILRL